jgi:hypothetical protein
MPACAGPPIETDAPRSHPAAHDPAYALRATHRELPLLRRRAAGQRVRHCFPRRDDRFGVDRAPFRDAAAEERLFFAIPGALCVPCRQLYVDRQLIGILGLGEAHCTFAIQSDRVLRAGAA